MPCHSAIAMWHDSAVPWLRRIVTGFPPRRPRFNPTPVNVESTVKNVAMTHMRLRALRFSSCPRYPSMSQTHSFITDATQSKQMTESFNNTLPVRIRLGHGCLSRGCLVWVKASAPRRSLVLGGPTARASHLCELMHQQPSTPTMDRQK